MDYIKRNESFITEKVFDEVGDDGYSYSAVISSQSNAATTETATLYVTNPSTSPRYMRIHSIEFGISDLTTNQEVTVSMYRTPTITANGTALTITSTRPSKATTANILAYKNPTASANGTLIAQYIATASFTLDGDLESGVYMDPGEAILITTQATATTVLYTCNISWTELSLT